MKILQQCNFINNEIFVMSLSALTIVGVLNSFNETLCNNGFFICVQVVQVWRRGRVRDVRVRCALERRLHFVLRVERTKDVVVHHPQVEVASSETKTNSPCESARTCDTCLIDKYLYIWFIVGRVICKNFNTIKKTSRGCSFLRIKKALSLSCNISDCYRIKDKCCPFREFPVTTDPVK